MLKISTCTVTNDPNNLLTFSIESIVNIVDEVLIYDDSMYDFDYSIFSKYKNVRILKDNSLNNLGQRKQYLVDNASNDIVLRWDDDFILYNKELLEKCYNLLYVSNLDYVITHNYNISFSLQYLNKNQPICNEAYLNKKDIIVFKETKRYSDYPVFIKADIKYTTFNECLFLHLSNFKSYEKLCFRAMLGPYNIQTEIDNYYEWMYRRKFNKTHYIFSDIIRFKTTYISAMINSKYKYDCIEKITLDLTRIDPKVIDYINNNYKIKPHKKHDFTFDTSFTKSILNLFYLGGNHNSGNFGDLLSFYIFEKLTGFQHVYCDIINKSNTDTHYMSNGSIIKYSNKNTIIWGSGTITQNIDKIDYRKVYCLRGPRTRNALLKYYTKEEIPEKYGDPALLTSFLYKPKTGKKYKIGIIPSIIDYKEISELFINRTDLCVINLSINKTNKDIEAVLELIQSCEFILSSSLHGIIVSNAYNIPVVRFEHNKLAGDDTKFIDYFESVYSDNFICETKFTFNECIEKLDEVKKIYIKPDLIATRQKDLLETCPFLDKSLLHLCNIN